MRRRSLLIWFALSVVAGWLVVAPANAQTTGSEEGDGRRTLPPTSTESGGVPIGFEPLRVVAGPGQRLEVQAGGRLYLFSDGPLPTEVQSLSTSIFDAPPKFRVRVSDDPVEIDWETSQPEAVLPRRVTIRTIGRLENADVEAKTTIAFDGMVFVSLTLRARQPFQLDTFAYDFSFPADIADLFNHHLAYDYRTMRVKRGELLQAAGYVPSEPFSIRFVPSFAIGNHEVGFEWWSDSDDNWVGAKTPSEPIGLRRENEVVTLSVAPIESRLRLEAGETWEHEFAVFALPTRRKPDRVHRDRFLSPAEAAHYPDSTWLRFFTILFPGQFEARWHGLPEAIPGPAQTKVRERLSRQGVGYIPYAKLTAAPSLHPTAMAKAKEWSAAGKLFTGPAGGERKFLNERGWKPGTAFSYAACVGDDGYLDWILEEVLQTVREESPAGLYFDWGSIMEPCTGPTKDGPLSWGYFNLRRFYRRLYEAVKAEDPSVLITIHTHGQPRSLAAFVDYVFVGEALNVPFRGTRTFKEIQKDPSLYRPHYMDLPKGFLDAQLFPRAGGTTALLPEVHLARDKRKPGHEAKLTRELFAETLVNGTPVWLTNCDPQTRSQVMKAVDQFGDLDGATMYPWWTDPLGAQKTPGLRASVYSAQGSGLLIVSNRNSEPTSIVLQPDLASLGIDADGKIQDPEQPTNSAGPIPKEGIRVDIPGRDFRLLLIR